MQRTDHDTVVVPRLGSAAIRIRRPRASDGVAVHGLIAACPPLDRNSLYCNLLQCTHFAETCALGEEAGSPVGFASGYLYPDEPETLFIWQVAVAPAWRGCGLGQKLIRDILGRPVCSGVRHLHATVGEENNASWSMFRRLAGMLGAPLAHTPYFDRHANFGGQHESEILLRIGAFAPRRQTAVQREAS